MLQVEDGTGQEDDDVAAEKPTVSKRRLANQRVNEAILEARAANGSFDDEDSDNSPIINDVFMGSSPF